MLASLHEKVIVTAGLISPIPAGDIAMVFASGALTVSVEDGHLVIHGERKQEAELKEEAYYRLETVFGTFERFIPLPEGFEEAEIEAAYEDGVLEVIVPAAAKALEPSKPRTIPIQTALPVKAAKVA